MGLLKLFKSLVEKAAPESLADEYFAQSSRFYKQASEELGKATMPVEKCHRAYDLFLKTLAPKSIFARCPPQPFHLGIATFACLPHPECGEALSLALFYQEFPAMARRHPKYEIRLGSIMQNILPRIHARDWDALNKMFQTENPNYHVKSPFPILSPEYEALLGEEFLSNLQARSV